ncbi:MAG: N-acetylglucosamine-6-phosphate deacetylase [Paracoccaceae bacterium]
MSMRALVGASIFDGVNLRENHALVLNGETIQAIVPASEIPTGCERKNLDGGTVLPGFVDLQVNGGGGVLFNEDTSINGLAEMAKAHATVGTRAFLPTLITDTPERTRAAVEAVEQAIAQNIPGIVGIHLEGPHLSLARKGAHDPMLIRAMAEPDEAFLLDAAKRLPNVMVTVAPESVTPAQINRLSKAGIVVSLGHSDCTLEQAQVAFAAGARCVTHLFNAMSQLTGRAPGLVGATLAAGKISAGLIADEIHVHSNSMSVALAAKQGPGEIFLVTDAMSPVGSHITEFQLNGRRVLRQNGRLTLEDGTLAGADLVLTQAISNLVQNVGISPERAFRMATSAPAEVLKEPMGFGHFTKGANANAIWMAADFRDVVSL